MTENEALIAEAGEIAQYADEQGHHGASRVIRQLVAALEVKERENPSNCTCGYGGFHEPENKNCEANND